MLESAPDAMVVVNRDGKISLVNEQTETLFGYRREELLGQPVELLVPASLRAAHAVHRNSYAANPLTRPIGVGLALYGLRKDGTEFPVEISLSPVETGEGIEVFSAIRDISATRQLEAELRRAKKELEVRVEQRTTDLANERDRAQSYLDIAEVILLALDRAGRIQMINRKGLQMFGYEEMDLIGKDWFETCIPESNRAAARKKFDGITASDSAETVEAPVLGRNGEERLIAWRTAPIRDRSGYVAGTLSSGEDITERRRLEQLLRQAHKMEAIGRLAGGIAHDFNNLLGVVLGESDLLLAEELFSSAQRAGLESIREAAEHGASLIRQLLVFSRQQILETQILDLNSVLDGAENMLRRLVAPEIILHIVKAADLAPVRADPSRILQVILNLVANAREAMPSGGRIWIESANVTLDESYANAHPGTLPGLHAMLSVADDGPGMDQEVLAHIFEPYFTTKSGGENSGMGLATAYGIVQKSGGSIWAYSEPGHGTLFKIFLPVLSQPFPSDKAEQRSGESHEEPPQGNETVLVVEDSRLLRRVIEESLTRSGYTVLCAADGEEALATSERYEGDILLLLTDLALPGMNGQQLAARLRQARPSMKVLYTSGYAGSLLRDRGFPDAGESFLEKPFTRQSLAAKVRGLLDAT